MKASHADKKTFFYGFSGYVNRQAVHGIINSNVKKVTIYLTYLSFHIIKQYHQKR
jgi:hypothetical protein